MGKKRLDIEDETEDDSGYISSKNISSDESSGLGFVYTFLLFLPMIIFAPIILQAIRDVTTINSAAQNLTISGSSSANIVPMFGVAFMLCAIGLLGFRIVSAFRNMDDNDDEEKEINTDDTKDGYDLTTKEGRQSWRQHQKDVRKKRYEKE